ncbi:DapH/DapD/GlmU-related protein [Larkinella knui]|uniref:Acyltransferase n=1 Tax=Larkinella knui TaxID=2025310 RepID=A0A3P1CHY8_9BACT|nr:acyltransferase [Larkinella knui]RRB12897.1 acyltransferase [Larkinella knui]
MSLDRKNDPLGYLLYRLYFYKLNLWQIISAPYFRLLFSIKKVSLGKDCKFWGSPIVVRYPMSKIQIGDYCRFRSDPYSNLIGVMKKCILSTNSANATIIIGNNCGFSGTTIGALSSIKIGNKVLCGANTLITDFDWHNIHPDHRSLPVYSSKPVLIEDNVFIGYGSIILKGVTIGQNSVIGANSVVVSSIPSNCIAAGNPCKVVKYLNTPN